MPEGYRVQTYQKMTLCEHLAILKYPRAICLVLRTLSAEGYDLAVLTGTADLLSGSVARRSAYRSGQSSSPNGCIVQS
jgi:hypothetical protein